MDWHEFLSVLDLLASLIVLYLVIKHLRKHTDGK